MNKRTPKIVTLPSKADILAFIRSHEGKAGTREIARAFGLRNANRVELKRVLRELADEGSIESGRKALRTPGALPETTIADIVGRDADGELIAVPADWDEAHGPAPRITIATPRRMRPGDAAGIGDRAIVRIDERGKGDDATPGGRIVKVLDRARMRVVGIFRPDPRGGGRLASVDKKQLGKEIMVPPGATMDAKDGDLVAAEVSRAGRFGLPTGRVKEKLGSLATERAVSMIAIHVHGLPHVFSNVAMAEAEAAPNASLSGREDWRQIPLVTIDPADAKDHDDAVHAQADDDPNNRGGFVILVAIADVAAYITPGTALDREALERGNSVYFPDRVIPMLPERISNDLCSLKPNVDRPALAVRMVIGKDGRKRSHTFHRVLMRSAAKLAYPQAQAAIDGQPDDITGTLLKPVLQPLYAAYEALKVAREERGPLDLDLPERKILLKPDNTVDRVIVPARLDAHRLIEEYMILANVAAAESLERAGSALIYRVHDEPSQEKLAALREFLQTMDISLPKGGNLQPEQFNRILRLAAGGRSAQLVNEVVLRSQAQAEYNPENFGHFGLNLRRYAHFTSPIRRYADLVVHRALIGALKLGKDGLPKEMDVEALAGIAQSISTAERRAMAAERETVDRLIAHFLADRIGATFEGRIAGVTRAGLFVKLNDTGADGFVPARTIGSDYYRYEEAQRALIGNATGEVFRLGDAVVVKLAEAIPLAGALRFELLSEGERDPKLRLPRGSRQDRKPQDRKPNEGPRPFRGGKGKSKGGGKPSKKKKRA